MICGGLSLAPSIDTFVESHNHDKDIAFIAKIAIAVCILRAEKKSKLALARFGHCEGFPNAAGSWLHELFAIMVTGASRPRMADMFKNVGFVIFNYDRCVEHFFIHALMQYFGCGFPEAFKAFETCSIVHPYGSLGALDASTIASHTQFAGPNHAGTVSNVAANMSANIRTYSEAETDPLLAQRARALLRWGDRAVFLGFGFHDQNVELLRPQTPSGKQWAIATAFNVSQSNQRAFSFDILRCVNSDNGPPFRDAITIADKSITCGQLIRDEAKRLSR